MATRYRKIVVTGVADDQVLDMGLQSTQQEQRTLVALHLAVSAHADNVVEGFILQTQHVEIPDYLIDTWDAAGSGAPYSTTKLRRVEINLDLAVGEIFQVGLRCGGTVSSLRGAYEYMIR